MREWLYGKEKNKWCSFRFFFQPKSCPAESQAIRSHPQQQSSCHSCTLEHGLTRLPEEEAFPVVTQAQGRAQGFGAAAAGPFLGHMYAHCQAVIMQHTNITPTLL